ncbi:MAG: type III pantothenate kinase, partial [Aequorivita sp.]|nr:type III pantothenate kinase [Aequorivita sp.]
YAGKNVLVIDAGTCITYDFLNSKNEYMGGAISPGISLRYKALHTFTEKLPLLEATNPNLFVGNTTATSMHSGVVNGVLYEIDGYISMYRKNYDNLTVILTGGDAHFLRDSIKNDIFANSNFLLEGLNHILEYNEH